MFANRTELFRHNPPQSNYGVAIADLDADGEFEIVVASNGGTNLVLKREGSEFGSLADETLADAGSQSIGLAAGDIDGDGREELYILNTDTFNGVKSVGDRLFDWRDGRWVDLLSLPEHMAAANLTAGRSVACIDRTGSGRYGFFVANYGGPLALYELDEHGELENVAAAAGVGLMTGGRGLLCLPLLPDSTHMDVFAANEGGANFFFHNRGDGTFEEIGQRLGLGDMYENARGVAAFDLNDDGLFDIACTNWEGPHRLFLRAGDGFRDVAPPVFSAPTRARTLLAADFDNDGREEVFVNNMGQPNRLFGWQGNRWVGLDPADALEPGGLGTGAAVGDFDHDGRLELVISHGESAPQPLSYYHTPDNGHSWLRVLALTRHGAPARGSIVRLSAGGRVQIRHVDAGSGYLCQMEPVAHFGLDDLDHAEWIEVQWPDGAKQRIDQVEARQVIRVPYAS